MNNSLLKKAGVYSTTVIVVPFLAVLGFMLVVLGVAFPLAMILESLGAFQGLMRAFDLQPELHMNIGLWVLPTYLNIPVSVVFGAALVLAGVKLRTVLKRYLGYVRAV